MSVEEAIKAREQAKIRPPRPEPVKKSKKAKAEPIPELEVLPDDFSEEPSGDES